MKLRLPKILRASSDEDHADLIFGTAGVEIEAAAKGQKIPRVSIEAYSGGIMAVAGFGRVVIDLDGLKLPRQVPLLADHDGRLQGIAGHGRARIEAGRLHVEGTLTSKTEAGQTIIDLARESFEFQSSVGVRPARRRFIRRGESVRVNDRKITAEDGGFTLIESGELREVSILSIGADAETQVNIAARTRQNGASKMGIFSRTKQTADTTADDDRHELRQRIEAAEQITPPDCGWKGRASEVAEIRAAFIADELDYDDFAERVKGIKSSIELDHLRANRPTGAVIQSTPRQRIEGEPADVLAAAFLVHSGHAPLAEKSYGERAAQRGVDLRCTSAIDLCRAALAMEGRDIPSNRDAMIRAAFSTTSLPIAFGSSLQKSAMETFRQTPATWRLAGAAKPVNNFREHRAIRPYHKNGRFDQIGADGEIKHTAPNEETFAHQADTYARMFSITRKHVINDDAGAVLELAQDLGRQGLATISDVFWTLILSNPSSFFHTDNGNLVTDTLSVDGLSAAIQAMREQTDGDGKTIDVAPFGLVVPPALEATARQVLNSLEVQRDTSNTDNRPTANPWARSLELGVEPRISNSNYTGNSTTQWYITANPMNVPAALVSFLNGRESPTIEQADSPANVLGLTWRGWIDFGVDTGDERGAVKSTGAG